MKRPIAAIIFTTLSIFGLAFGLILFIYYTASIVPLNLEEYLGTPLFLLVLTAAATGLAMIVAVCCFFVTLLAKKIATGKTIEGEHCK